MAQRELVIYWKDLNGLTTTTRHAVKDAATYATIDGFCQQMANHSSNELVKVEVLEPIPGYTGKTAGSGAYQSTVDKAGFRFVGSNSQPMNLSIPAPGAGNFDSSTIDVDPLAAGPAALLAAFAAKGVDVTGNGPKAYSGGVRTKGKAKNLRR